MKIVIEINNIQDAIDLLANPFIRKNEVWVKQLIDYLLLN